MAKYNIYQFYSELDGFTETKIWRRFQVRDDITVAKLGYITQVLFEMTASHLMAIEVPAGENIINYLKTDNPDITDPSSILGEDFHNLIWRYDFPNKDEDIFSNIHGNKEVFDATKEHLRKAVSHPNNKLKFYYDFGDGWQVSLTLEKIFIDTDLGKELPRVIEGAGFGIVEDCGGIQGLTELVKAFKKKKGDSYKHYREWLGINDFDITLFDLDDMNFRVKKIPRIYKEAYEDDLPPTQKSIDLIERRYLG